MPDQQTVTAAANKKEGQGGLINIALTGEPFWVTQEQVRQWIDDQLGTDSGFRPQQVVERRKSQNVRSGLIFRR